MTRASYLLLATTLLATTAAEAQRREDAERPIMAAGIAQDVIEVEVNYNDSRVIVFAATPQPENPTSGIAVALVGPIVPHRMIQRTATGEERIEFVGAPPSLRHRCGAGGHRERIARNDDRSRAQCASNRATAS